MSEPVRLDHFMARANAAYYASRDPLAEFATSPEISQTFGEVLGAFAIDLWARMGHPARLQLIEAGPGRGTLIADIWRIISRHAPAMAGGCEIHLIETSPLLRRAQAARLADAPQAARVQWHGALDDVPPGACIFLANEFFDALPIRQFRKTPAGWVERYVQNSSWVELHVDQPPSLDLPPDAAAPAPVPAAEAIFEIGDAARGFAQALAARLLRDGGVALIIDYGHCQSGYADTLQALLHGRPADPLADPGSRDLTAHVDFAAIARAARAVRRFGPATQGQFLTALGLPQRAAALAACNPDQAAAILDGADRLVAPTRMGTLFKVMALAHPTLTEIVGLPAGDAQS